MKLCGNYMEWRCHCVKMNAGWRKCTKKRHIYVVFFPVHTKLRYSLKVLEIESFMILLNIYW